MTFWRAAFGATILPLLAPAVMAQAQGPVVEAIPTRAPRAQATSELRPTSAWAADFAADNCSLTRTFGDGSGSVTLRLRQFAPGTSLEVTLASQAFELDLDRPTYAFADREPRQLDFYQTFRIDGGLRGVIFEAGLLGPTETADALAPYAADDPALRAVDRVTIRNAFDHGLVLRTGSLAQPLKVLSSCLDDLMTGWGLDAAAQHSLSKEVTEKDEDEPWPGQLQGSAHAVTEWPSDKMDFVLLVSETGQVGQCRLVGGLPDDGQLAERICDAMPKDWQFDPALDADGQPIKSYRRATMVKARMRTTVTTF